MTTGQISIYLTEFPSVLSMLQQVLQTAVLKAQNLHGSKSSISAFMTFNCSTKTAVSPTGTSRSCLISVIIITVCFGLRVKLSKMRAPDDKLSSSGWTLARILLCLQLPIVCVVGFQFTERFVFGSRMQRYDKFSYQGYV